MKNWFLVPALMVLSGCVHPVTDPAQIASAGDRPTLERAYEIAHRAVSLLKLKDPYSAVLSGVAVDGIKKWVEPNGAFVGWQISFFLNAKNGFGAYTGEKKYLCLLRGDGMFLTRESDAWHP